MIFIVYFIIFFMDLVNGQTDTLFMPFTQIIPGSSFEYAKQPIVMEVLKWTELLP